MGKHWLKSLIASVVSALTLLIGCAGIPNSPAGPGKQARLTPATQSYRDLINLPPPKGKIVASVYGFRDQTGQYKPAPDSSFSTAVTQGAGSILVKALRDSRWFIPVEREGLQNVLTERRIIRAAEAQQSAAMPSKQSAASTPQPNVVPPEQNAATPQPGVATPTQADASAPPPSQPNPESPAQQSVPAPPQPSAATPPRPSAPPAPPLLPALLASSVILEGGIVGYEIDVKSGGAGARYLGIGGSTLYRTDQVTVNLRAVDIRTGRILNNVSTTKAIYSYQVDFNVFKFVSFKHLLEVEVGFTRNEPAQLCVTDAVEAAVINLIVQGVQDNNWALRNADDANSPLFKSYVEEQRSMDRMVEKTDEKS